MTDFLWGAATAAFQIEGASTEGGREASIWDVFCQVPGAVANGDDGTVATDHYHRWEADVALMADLGLQAYRFSVAWPRVVSADGTPNAAGLDFYERLVDGLLAAGIEPWLTLYHWDLPASLPGGWLNRATAERFAQYALVVHDQLGDRVRRWTTLNEPWCSSMLSYGAGAHAPGHADPTEALTAAHHLLLGHGLAARALREADASASIGITLNYTPAVPADPTNPADVDVVRRVDGTAHRLFTDAVFGRGYPADVVADAGAAWPAEAVRAGDEAVIGAPLDFLGVNYYTTEMVRAGAPTGPSPHVTAPEAEVVPRGLPTTDMGWEIDPDGFARLLGRLHDTWAGPAGVPIYITENGAACADEPDADGFVDDTDRIAYLDAHLAAVEEARRAGADVRGYFAWTLLDNFEWAFGYAKRFGIVRVDEELRRIPKASARWFAQQIATGRLGAPHS